MCRFLLKKNTKCVFLYASLYKMLNVGSDHSYLVKLAQCDNGETYLFQNRLYLSQNLCSCLRKIGTWKYYLPGTPYIAMWLQDWLISRLFNSSFQLQVLHLVISECLSLSLHRTFCSLFNKPLVTMHPIYRTDVPLLHREYFLYI